MANSATQLTHSGAQIDAAIDAISSKYEKPTGGIPKTDLSNAVQTSLGKADTALQSYTETDPVFATSVAADITSSDITNWNSKTSNIGTITGIEMNGASKGTSGVVDLGTVITAHQDISGKADKATTYTKTEVDDIVDDYLPLSGGDVTGYINLVSKGRGLWLTDSTDRRCAGIHDNCANLWIGANATAGTHHTGETYISSGTGNTYISRLNNGTRTNYVALDVGNLNLSLNGDELTMDKAGSSLSNKIKLFERDYTVSHAIADTGWYRIGQFLTKANAAGTCFLLLRRSYGNANNESYIFALTVAYNGGISMTQIAGHYNTQRIYKIRIEYVTNNNDFYPAIDFHVSGTGNNTYRVTIIGSAKALETAAKDPTLTGSTKELSVVNGIATNEIVTCTSVVHTSDERKKEKVGDISINIKDIAAAPNITFTWKEGEDIKNLHGGTYAQYWEKVTPYYVHGEEGDKSLEYSPLSLSCSIQLAKEIVTLKEENAQLKKELAEIKEIISKLNK